MIKLKLYIRDEVKRKYIDFAEGLIKSNDVGKFNYDDEDNCIKLGELKVFELDKEGNIIYDPFNTIASKWVFMMTIISNFTKMYGWNIQE